MVQELAKLHGATVNVESELGNGSTFTITVLFGTGHLPSDQIVKAPTWTASGIRAQAYVEEALRWLPRQNGAQSSVVDLPSPSNADDLGGPALPLSSLATGRVLLADDNADMRDYVARLLVE
jgi:hypothetical protein